MTTIEQISEYLDDFLNVGAFSDYGPNGLQVQGQQEVKHIVAGVTASQALIDAAIENGADTILVHHGYFWKGEDPRLIGMKYHRIKSLMDANINLLAYHLPLDAHPQLGNNAELARLLGLTTEGGFGRGKGPDIGAYGHLPQAMSGEALATHIGRVLSRKPLHIAGNEHEITKLAWCTGGAQSYIEDAVALGVDAYITGEVSEHTVHVAREYGIHFYAAGHHATERYGVKALAEHLSQRFDLKQEFVDIDNPV
ncbi:MAG: Nif3-like dinuclear metal center hexameric protein [Gammaproteobacteria bacterium]|nr:Nif3-like dinuclear metal center hexameric protein [Gammaproteobacteria bacterium]